MIGLHRQTEQKSTLKAGPGDHFHDVQLKGRSVSVRIRRHARARHVTLRIDTDNDGALITLPPRVPVSEGLDLVYRSADWIVANLDALAPKVPFTNGAMVPYLGIDHLICHCPGNQGPRGQVPVTREVGVLLVAGRPEHLPRRLRDWMIAEARHEITTRVHAKVAGMGHRIRRITVRETRTRWGSCSEDGCLSFSWRLIMTPVSVLDYIVAHEVAHLRHMNHGPRFWRHASSLTDDMESARAWLKRHGDSLFRYG